MYMLSLIKSRAFKGEGDGPEYGFLDCSHWIQAAMNHQTVGSMINV